MNSRMMVNGVKLPFLTDQHIADEVQSLLAEYGTAREPIVAPPIPVDEIVELYMFAAHLLMPESFVRRVWHDVTTSSESLSLADLRSQPDLIIQSDIDRRMRYKTGADAEDHAIMESAAQPLADIFEVSAPAMRNRLQKLNLLVKTATVEIDSLIFRPPKEHQAAEFCLKNENTSRKTRHTGHVRPAPVDLIKKFC